LWLDLSENNIYLIDLSPLYNLKGLESLMIDDTIVIMVNRILENDEPPISMAQYMDRVFYPTYKDSN